MKLPRIKKRRLYARYEPNIGLMESDLCFIDNNMELVILLLEGLENKTIKIKQVKPHNSVDTSKRSMK